MPGLPLTFLPQRVSFPFLTKISSSVTKKIISFYWWQTTLMSLTSPGCFPHISCLLGEHLKEMMFPFCFVGSICVLQRTGRVKHSHVQTQTNRQLSLFSDTLATIPCRSKAVNIPQLLYTVLRIFIHS